MALLQIPTAVQSMTAIEGLKYQSTDVIRTLFVRYFAAMTASHLASRTIFCTFGWVNRGVLHRLESSPQWILRAQGQTRTANVTISRTESAVLTTLSYTKVLNQWGLALFAFVAAFISIAINDLVAFHQLQFTVHYNFTITEDQTINNNSNMLFREETSDFWGCKSISSLKVWRYNLLIKLQKTVYNK